MRFSKPAILALFVVSGFPTQGRAQAPDADPARVVAAQSLLKASGAVDAMIAAMRAAIPAQRQATPQIPAEFWTRFEARVVQDANILVDSVAVVYASAFSLQDLKDLTAFYNSPLGQRLRVAQPDLIVKSSAIGQRWGGRIGAEVGAALDQ